VRTALTVVASCPARCSEKYVTANYVLDGIADITPGTSQYVWGPDALRYTPKTHDMLMVFRRK